MTVSDTEIGNIIEFFSKISRKANSKEDKRSLAFMTILDENCQDLFSLDYEYTILNNASGELASTYPLHIIIPICSKSDPREKFDGDISNIRDFILNARNGRCRTRFPVPTILYENKFICRSSTLAGGPEIFGRHGFKLVFPSYFEAPKNDAEQATTDKNNQELIDKERNSDIRLLKLLEVQTLCDLMVENKKCKYGVPVTSSEKIDKENRYSDFTIVSVPYPGCEFFTKYRDNSYNPCGLVFDWNQSYIDAPLTLPSESVGNRMAIKWSNYKMWDLLQLTQNYLKLMLKTIRDGSKGLLVHCISGWDRTPLFISLLRLSLWADGKIHQKLSAMQILYLTLAYDWFLYSHNLVDRLEKGEEIMHFCFDILKHITSQEYSIVGGDVNRLKDSPLHLQLDTLLLEDSHNLTHEVNGTTTQRPYNAELDTTFEELDEPSNNDFEDLVTSNNHRSSSPMPVPIQRRPRAESTSSTGFGSTNITNDVPEVKTVVNRAARLTEVRTIFKRTYVTLTSSRNKHFSFF